MASQNLMVHTIVRVGIGLLFACSLAWSQAVLSNADKTFIHKAGISGFQEVQLSMQADRRTSSLEVRQFARRMIDDHSNASAELRLILSQKNVSAPDNIMNPEHTNLKAQLQQLGGSEFEQLYMTTMVKDHEAALADFQAESSSGTDPDIKAFAARQLKIIEAHLAEARQKLTHLQHPATAAEVQHSSQR